MTLREMREDDREEIMPKLSCTESDCACAQKRNWTSHAVKRRDRNHGNLVLVTEEGKPSRPLQAYLREASAFGDGSAALANPTSLTHCTTIPATNALYEAGKRLMDILVSGGLMLLSMPLIAVLSLGIAITSPGPIFFRQKRLGRNGREFWCYKFRTMIYNAEDHLKKDATLSQQFKDSFKIKEDPRVTPFGSFLRRMSLDEVPQFLNVLIGDMSIIGPRPIVPNEIEKYHIYGEKLLTVKPGLGGVWQVSGRSNTTYTERIAMDMYYIDHRTLIFDIQLLLKTAVSVFKSDGAY